MRPCRTLYLATVLMSAGCSLCLSQEAKLVECPSDRVYRDNRGDAGGGNAGGGQVYCEHLLPGSLAVKDGPFRFWFNRDFEGAAGNYHEGREIGKWKECDRFGRCAQKDYPSIYPEEKARPGFKSEIPVKYIDGKYVFDFASCRLIENRNSKIENDNGSRTLRTVSDRRTAYWKFAHRTF